LKSAVEPGEAAKSRCNRFVFRSFSDAFPGGFPGLNRAFSGSAARCRSQIEYWASVMDVLTLFGLIAVTAMLIFYALEDHSPWFILAFGGACPLAAVYGFLHGAWPFGIIEAIWAGVAVNRWRTRTLTATAV
jgi:hypothetical protein